MRSTPTRKLNVHGASRGGTFTIYAVLILVSLSMILPFIHELAKSLSFPTEVIRGNVTLVPRELTVRNYTYFMNDSYRSLWRAFLNSAFITSVGTVWSVFSTAVMAYPLSRPRHEFKAGPFAMSIVVFSIVFFPPIIPYFLAVRAYGLVNSLWAIILAHTIAPFNLILVVSYYKGLPEDMFDSCRIDGGNDIRLALQIAIPLSKPVLATIGVYTAVVLWNIFLHALLFIRDPRLMPLQPIIRSIVQESVDSSQNLLMQFDPFRASQSTKSAVVLMSIAPIVAVYPFLQRYFVKGALLGAVKS